MIRGPWFECDRLTFMEGGVRLGFYVCVYCGSIGVTPAGSGVSLNASLELLL